MNISVLGIDLGKRSFHRIGHDKRGNEQLRKSFTRKKLLTFYNNSPTHGDI